MRHHTFITIAALLVVGPLAVSGVLEFLDIGGKRTSGCYSSAVRLSLKKTMTGFEVTDAMADDDAIALLVFDPLRTEYWKPRIFFDTRYSTNRELRAIGYAPQNFAASEDDLTQIRAKLSKYLRESDYFGKRFYGPVDEQLRREIASGIERLVSEINQPDVHRSGIFWPGVYFNGLFVMVLFLMPIGLVLYPFTPYSRRKHRLEAGHCPMCDYDLRGSMNGYCPECGWRR
jgi:hypothetical protein